jgi:hypothetical protein
MTTDSSDEPIRWDDLNERTRINLCCDLIATDSAWFYDAVTDLPAHECVELLRALKDSKLGRRMRRAVVDLCRKEVERRLESGDFLP